MSPGDCLAFPSPMVPMSPAPGEFQTSALVLVISIESRIVTSAWWLGVVAGLLEVLVGFWASQQLVPARAVLLIIWVGVLALFRGITEIVLAFELKGAQHA